MQKLEASFNHQMQINAQVQAATQQSNVDMTALGTTIADEIA